MEFVGFLLFLACVYGVYRFVERKKGESTSDEGGSARAPGEDKTKVK